MINEAPNTPLFSLPSQMFGNWTFGTLVFTVLVFTVTLKVCEHMSLEVNWGKKETLMLTSMLHK